MTRGFEKGESRRSIYCSPRCTVIRIIQNNIFCLLWNQKNGREAYGWLFLRDSGMFGPSFFFPAGFFVSLSCRDRDEHLPNRQGSALRSFPGRGGEAEKEGEKEIWKGIKNYHQIIYLILRLPAAIPQGPWYNIPANSSNSCMSAPEPHMLPPFVTVKEK